MANGATAIFQPKKPKSDDQEPTSSVRPTTSEKCPSSEIRTHHVLAGTRDRPGYKVIRRLIRGLRLLFAKS
jgi:hypothetical protein